MIPPQDTSEAFRVLWIEDDFKYAELLKLELGNRFHFEVVGSLSPEEANALGAESRFHAVMIDMHLAQGRQGPQDFQRIRQFGYPGPIFVLSNDESVVSKIEMLALGVDDYLWKVMPTEELELRLKNAIQRYRERDQAGVPIQGPVDSSEASGASTHRLALEGLEINLDRLTAFLNDKNLEFSKIELKIMLTLLRHHPQPTAVVTLRAEVWENTAVENGTLSTFFWKLNKKTQSWNYRIVRAADEVRLKRL
jgi:DNA-binding response OmpR family regulator